MGQDKEPRGIIPLENLSIREVDDPRKPVRPSLSPSRRRGGAPQAPGPALPRCPASPVSPQNCFELYIPHNKGQLIKACKTEADGRVVEGNHMVYRISAPTQEEKDEWIKSIQ